MEDVLDLYTEALDPLYPQVCFDERPVQLLGDVYAPLPTQPGQNRRWIMSTSGMGRLTCL